MFLRVMRAERYKLRRSPVWLAFLIMPLFPAFFGSVNFMNNQGLLSLTWESLWTQNSLFSSYFFYPALVGVYCSYLWRLEHFDHNWNQVLTAPVPVYQIILGKLTLAAAMSAIVQLWGMALFLLAGTLCGVPFDIFPATTALWWLFGGISGGIAMASFQLLLSLVIRSFAVPVGIAMAGGILGLGLSAKGLGYFCPYSLLNLGMNANGRGHSELNIQLFFVCCAGFLVLFSVLGVVYLKKRDVKTG